MLKILEKQFRQPSGFFGIIISSLMQRMNDDIYIQLIKILAIKNDENLFEIGYGHGIGIEKILAKYDCFVSGIDFSSLMHKKASKRNKIQIDNGSATLLCRDFLTYELEKGTYDKIFCLNVIYFWDNLEIPFSKIREGLKENGVFCFYMEPPEELKKQGLSREGIFNKYSIDLVIEKLKISGFHKIETQFDKGYFVSCTNSL